MVQIKRITIEEARNAIGKTGFNQRLTVKDYYITALLYLFKDIKGIYFKGGTALQKIFLNYSRLSEDIDFTVTREISELKKEITQIIENSDLFKEVTKECMILSD